MQVQATWTYCLPAQEASMSSFNISIDFFLLSLHHYIRKAMHGKEAGLSWWRDKWCDRYKWCFLLAVLLEKKAGINVCPVKQKQWYSALYEAQMSSASLSCEFTFSSGYKLQLGIMKCIMTFYCLLFLSRRVQIIIFVIRPFSTRKRWYI